MNKKHFILRFCGIYLCVLLPLLGTSILVTQNFFSRAEEEELRKLSTQIARVENSIKENFFDYKNKSVILFENKEFSSKQVLSNPYTVREAVRLLHSISLFDNAQNEILLNYGNGNLLFSGGVESPNTYFSKTLACSKVSVEKALKAIEEEQYCIRILYSEGRVYLLYHIPVGKDAYGKERSMEVIIKVTQLKNMLSSCISSENVLLELRVNDESCYFLNTEQGGEFVPKANAGDLVSKYVDLPMSLSNEDLDFEVKIWSNIDGQLHKFYRFRNINIFILSIGLLFSVAFSSGLSVMRFSKIKELVNNIIHKSIVSKEKGKWMSNEFDYIQTILNESIEEYHLIKRNADIYKHALRKQVTALIFHGMLKNIEEIRTILNVSGMKLYEEYFYLCGIRVENEEQLLHLEDIMKSDLHYVVNEPHKKEIFILGELPHLDFEMSSRKKVRGYLHKLLGDGDILNSQIVFSRVYNQICLTNYAYLEVSSMLKYLQYENYDFICWEEWAQQIDYSYECNNEYVGNFIKAVEQKNEPQAKKILKRMLQLCEKDESNARYICYTIMQALQLGIRSFIEGDNQEQFLERISSINMENQEKFEEEVKGILSEYCSKPENNIDKIIQYVNENYASYDLSLETIANHMGISKSQMSKLFREEMGIGYIDYVTDLRMNKVKELLEQTDLSVAEIFAKVGYIDKSNATKKFKNLYGVSPSDYRSQARIHRDEVEKDGNLGLM